MVTYGTTAIPSDQIEVIAGSTVSVSLAFDNTVGLVGGMETDEGTATEGEVTRISSPSDASDKFGEDSELHEQSRLAFQNGAGVVYALPVEETSVDAEQHSSGDGTLENAPVFDPRVNEEHEITVTDEDGGELDVEYVDEPPTEAPSTEDTVEIYPPSGEYYADDSPDGSDYEFDYTYGDYSTEAVEPLIDESPRIIAVLTESEEVANDIISEVNSRATDFDFMHVVTDAQVGIDETSTYSNDIDERRLTKVYPARGYTDDAETNEERTAGAVAGYLASLTLGLSSTNDSIGGFSGLKNELSGPQEAGDLRDERVMPLLDYPPVTIVIDMTTSEEPKFERVYAMQIADEITELVHQISRNFVGEQNTSANRLALRRSYINALIAARSGTPPLLDDFTVSVSESESDPNVVDVKIGIDIVDVMDSVSVVMEVGDIIRDVQVE